MPGRNETIERCRAEIAALRSELEQLESGSGWQPKEIRTGANLADARIEEIKGTITAKEAALAYMEKRADDA
jgi:hypothetical protein